MKPTSCISKSCGFLQGSLITFYALLNSGGKKNLKGEGGTRYKSKQTHPKNLNFFVIVVFRKTQHLYLQLPGVSVLDVLPGSSHHLGCAQTAHGSHSLPVSKLMTCSSFLPSSSCPPPNTPPAALLSLKSYLLLFSTTASSRFNFTQLPGHL